MIIDCHNHLGSDLFFYFNGYYPYAQDLPALVTEGRRLRVDRWVVFPMMTPCWFDLAGLRRGQLRPGGPDKVPFAFENERMLREVYEQFPALGRRTLPFAILDPMREPAAQVRSLRALHRKFPFYGLKIDGSIIQSDVGTLLTTGRCFLEFAEEKNLPFLIYSSITPGEPGSDVGLLLRIAEAAPQVRFCLAHSCRFDREYLDRVAGLPNTWFDCAAHSIHCQGAVLDLPFVAAKDRRFAADYSNPSAVLHALADTYPEKMIWGSDTPFETYIERKDGQGLELRATYEEEIACLRSLPKHLTQAIAHDNLLRLLHLKDDNVLWR